MKKEFLIKLIKILIPLLIIFFGIFLSWKNYAPDTWLSGWDTLHPEFNFSLALKRAFFGAWREEQGVGALAAHSHMAELPRIIFLWLSSFILPQNFLRFFYVFLAIILGPLGFYFFVKEAQEDKNEKNILGLILTLFAYATASTYFLLNFENLQNFYVPFEMFITLFAFIGWLFFLALKAVKTGKNKYFFLFFLVSLISAPMAYAATLFYSWLLAFTLFLVVFSLISANKSQYLRRSFVILALVLTANAYWLLPNLYSIKNQSQVIAQAKINRLFTPEAFLSNQAYGDIKDVAIGKNHLFSWREFDSQKVEFVDLLDEWNNYLKSDNNIIYPYIVVFFSILGLILALVKKDRVGISLLPLLFLSLFFLINENPPFTLIYSFLRKNLGIFAEGFRMPFTKFSIVYIFAKAYFLGYFAKELLLLLNRKKITKFLGALFLMGLAFIIVKPMLPALEGNFISRSMRNNIPQEYFELFDYLKDKEGRIAKLPLHTWGGWAYYDWDYEGAGFLSFGIDNPILDRDFDRWSPYNESFYNEASSALYQQDLETFEKVLAKYQVAYLINDKSVVNAGGKRELLFIPETEALLDSSRHIQKEKEIGFLTLYKTDFATGSNNVRAPTTYTNVNADLTYQEIDPIYREFGDYVKTGSVSYPFVNLDKRMGVNFSQDGLYLYFKRQFDKSIAVAQIVTPNFFQEKINTALTATIEGERTLKLTLKHLLPKIIADGTEFNQEEGLEVHEFMFKRSLPDFVEIADLVFDLRNVSQGQEKMLGSIVITPKEESTIKFYSQQNVRYDVADSLLAEKPRLCSDPEVTFPLNPSDNGFILEASTEAICFGSNFEVQDAIYEFSFEAKSATTTPQFCLTAGGRQQCLDAQLPAAYQGEGDGWQRFKFQVPLSIGDSWMDFVVVGSPNKKAQITFRNFEVKQYPKVGAEKYAFGASFKNLSSNLVFAVNKDISELTLAVPVLDKFKEDFGLDRGNKEAINCDVKKVGTVRKQSQKDKVVYGAEGGGVSCDYYNYPQLSYNFAYLLQVRGNNSTGRGLKIYLFNKKTARADLEEITPDGNYDEYYPILPKSIVGGGLCPSEASCEGGYTFNTETRSFGRIASENLLSSLSFTLFGYAIPASTQVLTSTALEPQINQNSLEILDVGKTGTYKYQVNGKWKMENGKSGLLVLSQGYDTGWKAYPARNYQLPMTNYQLKIPVLNKPHLEHFKVNSWENGWIINGDQCPETNNQLKIDSCELMIVFWPQYLEFLGLGLIIAGLIFMIRLQLTRKLWVV